MGDMGGGMPPDAGGMPGGMPGDPGGMEGGMPGGMPAGGMGGAPGGMPAAASANALPVIGKRGSKNKQQEESEQAPPPQMIKLTKLEQKMYRTLTSMDVPYDLFAQYQVRVPGEARPYAIDFAYPKIGVGVEVDGAIWHEREDFKQRDLNRDQKLGNVGWTVLRFNEDAVNENIDAVRDTISKYVASASKSSKKAEEDGKVVKIASKEEVWKNPQYEYCLTDGKIGCKRETISHGKILYIGRVENEQPV